MTTNGFFKLNAAARWLIGKSFVPRRTALAGQSIGQKDFDIHSVPSSNASPVERHVLAGQPENRGL